MTKDDLIFEKDKRLMITIMISMVSILGISLLILQRDYESWFSLINITICVFFALVVIVTNFLEYMKIKRKLKCFK